MDTITKEISDVVEAARYKKRYKIAISHFINF